MVTSTSIIIGIVMHRLGGKRSAAATVSVITETIGHINDDDDDDECPQWRAAENLILSRVHTLHAYRTSSA